MKTFLKIVKSFAFIALALPLMANEGCEEQVAGRKLKKRVALATPAITAQPFVLPGNKVYSNLGAQVSAQMKLTLHKHSDFYLFERAAPRGDIFAMAAATPTCVQDFAMYEVGGTIPTFEFVSKTKISFGYSKTGDFGNIVIEPSVEVEKAQLDLVLEAYNPLTRILKAMGGATSDDTSTSLKAKVGYNDFNVTPEVYKDKPIGKVTQKAVDKALAQLSADTADQPWFAQVEQDADRYIIINAGKNAGLKKDDVLTVHNQIYMWQNNGTPCQVPLLRHLDKRNGTADAIIKLERVEDDYSISYVDPERPTDEPVMPGAIVRLKEFAP
jgi:hypothetical protein